MRTNWQTKKLEDICDFHSGLWKGKTPPYIKASVIRNTNFTKDGGLDYSAVASLDVEKNQFLTRALRYGDIILEKSGGGPKQPVGRVAVFSRESGSFSFSNFTSAIRVKNPKEVDCKYLHRYLFASYLSGATETMQRHSTGIRNLKLSEYKQIPVPIPSLHEQKRIVVVLDKAFAAIAKAKESAEKNLANARELFESYQQKIFAQHSPGEIERPLGECVNEISTGPFGSLLHKADYEHGMIPLVNPTNISGDEIVPDRHKAVSVKTAERLRGYKLRENDVVIGRRGEIGRCAVVASEQDGWICGTGCFIIRPSDITDPYFLAQLLRSRYYRSQLEKVSKRATMPSISNSDLAKLIIRLPTLEKQRSALRTLNGLSKETQSLKTIYHQKLSDLEELKKSILQKAFNGELLGANS